VADQGHARHTILRTTMEWQKIVAQLHSKNNEGKSKEIEDPCLESIKAPLALAIRCQRLS
jgi:hypothetical protein